MKYLFLISCFFFNFLISYSQDLNLNKTDIKLKVKHKIEEVKDTVSMKINYSYLSGLDLFYFNHQDKIIESKSGIISLSFHYRANQWKYGIGMNYSNYKTSSNSHYSSTSINSSYEEVYFINTITYDTVLSASHRILTPILTLERFLNKNLYVGVHLGCNFRKTDNNYQISGDIKGVGYFKQDNSLVGDYKIPFNDKTQDVAYEIFPYTKFCIGYQFKLSNHLNFNLELGVGGSMTNTGFAYLFR